MAPRSKRKRSGDSGAEAPRARPFWSGTLSFGLVSIPVALYSAVRSRRPGLRMLDAEGQPLERRYFDRERGKTLAREDIVRGFEVEEGKFVVVEDDELDRLAPEKSRDIDLRRFVPVEQLDPLYFERTYFLAPDGGSSKAYRLLAATMERSGRAGIATFVMRESEYLTAILAEDGLLRAETMRFHDELRTPEDVGLEDPPKAPAAARKRMQAALRSLHADALDEDELEDPWTEKLEALVARKRKKGEDVVAAPAGEEPVSEDVRVIDLLEVLRRSMAAAESGASGTAAKGGRRAATRAKKRGGAAAAPRKDEEALGSLSKQELYDRARELDIPGRSAMSKRQLVRAIANAA